MHKRSLSVFRPLIDRGKIHFEGFGGTYFAGGTITSLTLIKIIKILKFSEVCAHELF